jgi:hypothetical protein
MGKLGNQPNIGLDSSITIERVEMFIDICKDIAKNKKIEFSEVLKMYDILERQRTNNLYIEVEDHHDENISGIGELMATLNENISNISESLKLDSIADALQKIATALNNKK